MWRGLWSEVALYEPEPRPELDDDSKEEGDVREPVTANTETEQLHSDRDSTATYEQRLASLYMDLASKLDKDDD